MGNIVFKKYNPSILRNACLIKSDKGYMDTFYLADGSILQRS